MPSTPRRSSLVACGLAITIATTASCDWISLAKHSRSYATVASGESANVVALDSVIFATRAEQGLAVVDGAGEARLLVSPPAAAESADDLAIAGDLLLVLDARPPGYLASYSLRNPLQPRLTGRPVATLVGPFSSVSAANGVAIVSGGTSELSAFRYDSSGELTGPIATADLGRGQPDVILSRDGRVAYVSTHYWGPYFGIDVLSTTPDEKGRLPRLGRLELDGAGFTDGGAKPANFPVEAAILDDSTLLVAHGRGLAVVGVVDPANPTLEEVIDLGGPAVNVDAFESTAAVSVAGDRPAIAIIDFPTAGRPTIRRIDLPPGTLPLGVALSRAQLAVAARDRGVLVFRR